MSLTSFVDIAKFINKKIYENRDDKLKAFSYLLELACMTYTYSPNIQMSDFIQRLEHEIDCLENNVYIEDKDNSDTNLVHMLDNMNL